MTYENLPNVISSRVSAAGPMPCDLRDGLMTGQSGQEAALASLSARQAKERGLLTSGTCGPASSGSSASVALTQSLASRLQARTRLLGGTLFTLTWKQRITPAGFVIPALRASVRPTSDKDCTGWRSPNYTDGEGGIMEIRPGCAGKYKLRDEAPLASWPTPQSYDAGAIPREPRYKGNAPSEKGKTRNPEMPGSYRKDLKDVAGWTTPNVRDYKDSPNQIEVRKDGRSRLDVLSTQAMKLAGWFTPTEADGTGGFSRKRLEQTGKLVNLQQMVEWKLQEPCRLTASGQILTGSGAGIKSGGRLFPLFPCWLMGFPVVWDMIAQQIKRKKV